MVSILLNLVTFLGVFASPLARADGPKYLIWDAGSKVGRSDAGDTIIDVAKSCDDPGAQVINLPGIKSVKKLPQINAQPIEETKEILKSFSLPETLAADIQVPYSYMGTEKTLFILLPEAHHSGPSPQAVLNGMKMQMARTGVAAQLVDQAKAPVLNLSEGITNRIPRVTVKDLSSYDRDSQILLLGANGVSTFLTLGTIFENADNVKTEYLEPKELPSQEIVLKYGDFSNGVSFKKVLKNVSRVLGDNFEVSELKEAFDHLKPLSNDDLTKKEKEVCMMRGSDIGWRAVQASRDEKAKLVFLSYGLSHHPQIADALRVANMRYLVVMPRLNP